MTHSARRIFPEKPKGGTWSHRLQRANSAIDRWLDSLARSLALSNPKMDCSLSFIVLLPTIRHAIFMLGEKSAGERRGGTWVRWGCDRDPRVD
jgi:hypothetical protein